MHFTAKRALVAGCVALFSLSHSALGAPHPKQAQPRAVEAKRVTYASSALVAEARKYLGTNPTERKRLWCAAFMNFVLAKLGYDGTHSDAAKSFAYYGHRIAEPRVGAIAVLSRGKNGGHVGVVSGLDANGNPIIISGNHNKTVGEAVYPRSRVIAYVMPTERRALHPLALRGPRKVSEPTIDSPITELLALIEAERARAEAAKPTEPVRRPQPAPSQPRVEGRIAPVIPSRVVQQLPDQADADRVLSERRVKSFSAKRIPRLRRAANAS